MAFNELVSDLLTVDAKNANEAQATANVAKFKNFNLRWSYEGYVFDMGETVSETHCVNTGKKGNILQNCLFYHRLDSFKWFLERSDVKSGYPKLDATDGKHGWSDRGWGNTCQAKCDKDYMFTCNQPRPKFDRPVSHTSALAKDSCVDGASLLGRCYKFTGNTASEQCGSDNWEIASWTPFCYLKPYARSGAEGCPAGGAKGKDGKFEWQWVKCGLWCTASHTTCALKIFSTVISAISAAGKIVAGIMSGGASLAVDLGANIAKAAVVAAAKLAAVGAMSLVLKTYKEQYLKVAAANRVSLASAQSSAEVEEAFWQSALWACLSQPTDPKNPAATAREVASAASFATFEADAKAEGAGGSLQALLDYCTFKEHHTRRMIALDAQAKAAAATPGAVLDAAQDILLDFVKDADPTGVLGFLNNFNNPRCDEGEFLDNLDAKMARNYLAEFRAFKAKQVAAAAWDEKREMAIGNAVLSYKAASARAFEEDKQKILGAGAAKMMFVEI